MTKKDDNKKDDADNPDGLTAQEKQAGGDYARLDNTRDVPVGAQGDGIPASVTNPAFYPKDLKPEVLHTEAEKAGSEWPGTKEDKEAWDAAGAEVAGPSRALPPQQDKTQEKADSNQG